MLNNIGGAKTRILFERSEFLIATCKKKKTDRVCVCVNVRLILVLVCTYVCFLVLVWKKCLGFTVGYQRAPGTRELDRLLQLHQTELRPHLPRARPSLMPRDAQLQAWGGKP